MNVGVAEMYSPPRVTVQAEKFGLRKGEAMDLTKGWDFTKKDHRERARRYVEEKKPLVVIGSPPCTPFSQLQTLNPHTDKSEKLYKELVEHMRFAMTLYKQQVDEGRVFIPEQPKSATSWALSEVWKIMSEEGVSVH